MQIVGMNSIDGTEDGSRAPHVDPSDEQRETSMQKLDYKKEYKRFYMPTAPCIVDVPEMLFVMVDGEGNPNTAASYRDAVELLYGLSYSIKMSKTGGARPEGYVEYVVPPLEGLWWVDGFALDGMDTIDKDRFRWTSMIRQPEFVTEGIFEAAKATLARKKPALDASSARLVSWKEGLCAQIMHIGPFDDEPATVALLTRFIQDSGYVTDIDATRWHHEIYLGDPRRTEPEKLKTVIRHPITRG